MIFGVAKLVSYLSEFMTLLPGDVMRLGVNGRGEQQQRAVAWGTGRAGGLDRHTAA